MGKREVLSKILSETKVVAHRGWSAQYPENTLIAFDEALKGGADGIEFDVHRTLDGKLVVIHDACLERTTNGQGWVEDYTLSELQALDAGSWLSEEFSAERIPTLRQVLELILQQPRKVLVNIEMKDGREPYQGLGTQVWDCVEEMGLNRQVVISSFNHHALRELKQSRPRCQIAILYLERLVEPWRYGVFLRAEGLHAPHETVTLELVRAAHVAGQRVRVFTVNKEADMRRQLMLGVDAIITDHPDVLLRIRELGRR